MDSSVGRFSSKDPIMYLNLYRYVENNPLRFRDRLGLDPQDEDEEIEHDVDWMCENWGSNPPTFGLATSTSSGAGSGTIWNDPTVIDPEQSFGLCMANCESELAANKTYQKKYLGNENNLDDKARGPHLALVNAVKWGLCALGCAFDTDSHTEFHTVDIGGDASIKKGN